MAANDPSPPYSLRLSRVFGPSLYPSKHWYAVSSEWFKRSRDFSAGMIEISIYDLVDHKGAHVIPSLFGSTWKKDMVVVSTLFGILVRALRKSNQTENKVLSSIEFKAIKDVFNALPIEQMAGSNRCPANVPDIPPSSPEELNLKNSKNGSSCSVETSTSFETIENLENMSIRPRVKMRQTGAVAEKCLDEVRDRLTSIGPLLGKTFVYGFLYCDQGRKDVISTAFKTPSPKTRYKEGDTEHVARRATSKVLGNLKECPTGFSCT